MRYKYIKANSAETHRLVGGEITSLLVTGEDTNNRVSIFDSLIPQGNAAPWHYHEIDDEIFYIIHGSIEFGVENEVITAGKGDLLVAGPNVKRRFKALTDSHLLVINLPSGPSENFIRDIARLSDGTALSKQDRLKFAKKYKIHFC
ncbi:cupin domain-containing protein [Pseudoalteromonas piscicida]|uniref:cupin domain-containing protein n=1 Tax=Pseudoalteromonas piscicida TaxID=43662 RepID=UPI0027385513|nr:cupin domain-containing protein [Pseudoalteromonas piscicida]MDP4489499.1 cupin domain-containing protein [Pseudoalteromonas piscicida]